MATAVAAVPRVLTLLAVAVAVAVAVQQWAVRLLRERALLVVRLLLLVPVEILQLLRVAAVEQPPPLTEVALTLVVVVALPAVPLVADMPVVVRSNPPLVVVVGAA